MKTFIQKLGKSLMGPLSIIVAAGLLLGLASTLLNPNVFGNALANVGFVNDFVSLINALAGGLFGLLPILFCMSVAQGMSREDKEVATFASIIGFILFHTTIRFFLGLKGVNAETTSIEYLMGQGMSALEATQKNAAYDTVMGIFTYRMSIFGGIIVGLWTAMIHNRFHETQLPTAFSFFSGKRFVPIMMVVTIPFLAIVMFFVWPLFNMVINGFGALLASAGAFGTFIYGFLERLLIPTGLHHILNQLIRFTPIGGSAMIDGQQVSGALNIFNTLLMQAEPDMDVMRQATRFLTQGTHPFMVFGLPAACYAMYKTALPKNKQKVKGILLAVGLTSLFTGITEPIEFSFFFISPLLWLFHAFMAGMSFLINTLLGVCIGNAGGGLIDLMLFGVLRGPQTKWLLNVVIGLIYAMIYFFVFKWAIVKFNIKTPGREDETDEVVDTDEVTELGNGIMDALGGKENILEIDNCISRLRLVLKDTSIVNDALLKRTGSLGIIKINENNIQVVYGTKVEKAAAELKRAVKKGVVLCRPEQKEYRKISKH
ncbi:PTS transporter subunit EIIC [Enterocloster clostridioformis]|uniref:PTS transporter subunit EIIC n=1 Tax=Enterocloster clostridioformis TaxID=1531 RepID=UPI0036F41B15